MDTTNQDPVIQIPFGRTFAFLDQHLNYLRELKDTYHVLINNFQELNMTSLSQITSSPHRFTIGLTGKYWYLYGIVRDGIPQTVLIDRSSQKHFIVQLNFDKAFFQGTLISGEIVGAYFIAQDVLICNGDPRYYLRHNLDERQSQLTTIFSQWLTCEKKIDCLFFVTRHYFPIDQLESAFDFNRHVKNFGLSRFKSIIFTPVIFNRYPNSFTYAMKNIDWQGRKTLPDSPADQHKQIMKVRIDRAQPDVYQIFDLLHHYHGLAYVPSIEFSKDLVAKFEKNDELELSCNFIKEFKKWRPELETEIDSLSKAPSN